MEGRIYSSKVTLRWRLISRLGARDRVAALLGMYSFACEKIKLFCKVLRYSVQNDLILTSKPPRVADQS